MASNKIRLTERLVEYIQGLTYDTLPPEVIDQTKLLFMDFLGVAFGGRIFAESSGPILESVKDLLDGQRGSCTVVGEVEQYPSHAAALLNGAFAHSMDFDDGNREGGIHPGAPIFATLMALAEETGATGRQFITAAVAAYDVANKVNRSVGDGPDLRGFHGTSTTGIFGATVGGGHLLGLDREQTLNALGINVSQAAGSYQFLENGSWNKRLQVGLSASNAIYALTLARRGFQGARQPLEGRFGYFFSYSAEEWDPAEIRGLGTEYEVMQTGIKPYPSCRFTHGPMEAVVELMQQHRLAAPDIESIDVVLSSLGHELAGLKPNPTNVVEGQFSIHFVVALGATDGNFTWQSYDKLQDPSVRRIMGITNCHPSPQIEVLGSRVEIVTKSGLKLSKEVPIPKGEPENPLTQEDTTAKFLSLVEGTLGANGAHHVARAIQELENVEDFNSFARALRQPLPVG